MLADCLDGLDLVYHAAGQLDSPAVDSDLAGAILLGDFCLLHVIGRGVDARPVAATRPGVWRRVRKWARRHRPVVATAAMVGVVLRVTAVVVLSLSMARVAREKAHKDEALEQAKANLDSTDRQRARAERNSPRASPAPSSRELGKRPVTVVTGG